MGTTTQPDTTATPAAPPADVEKRFVLHDVPWAIYEALRDSETNRHVRMTYDSGTLELLSPGQKRNQYGVRFGFLLVQLGSVLGFKCKALAATTWKNPEVLKGKEADACFYLANCERVRGKLIDLREDPPPDLAIEVEMSRGDLDPLEIYAALRVPEVWRFDGRDLHIHERQADGSYLDRPESPSLPFLKPGVLVRCMNRSVELDDDVAWTEEIRRWAAAELLPRYRAE